MTIERLNYHRERVGKVALSHEGYRELVEALERLQAVTAAIPELEQALDLQDQVIAGKNQEIERLRGVLAVYADRGNWGKSEIAYDEHDQWRRDPNEHGYALAEVALRGEEG